METPKKRINRVWIAAAFTTALLMVAPTALAGDKNADMEIGKESPSGDVFLGEQITYVLTVENVGDDKAKDVVVTDELPSGMVFVSVDNTDCDHVDGVVTCELGDIDDDDDPIVIEIVVEATEIGFRRNTANVTQDKPEDDPNSENNEGGTSNTVLLRAPENLECDVEDTHIALTWDAVDGAERYDIFRDVEGGGFAFLADTTDTFYDDFAVSDGVTYTYQVKAFNETEDIGSDFSEECEGTAIPFFPGVIGGFLATLGSVFAYRRARRT